MSGKNDRNLSEKQVKQKTPKYLPEAPPEYPEIVYKSVSFNIAKHIKT